MVNKIGYTHIEFEVDNVDIILKKALKYGATTLGEVIENEARGNNKTITPSKIICVGRNYVEHIEELY